MKNKLINKKRSYWNDFFVLLQIVAFILVYIYVIKPFLFPHIPTSLEIYKESYKEVYGKDLILPDYLEKELKK